MVEIDYDAATAREGSVLPAFARALGRDGLFDGLELRLNRRGDAVSGDEVSV